MALPWSYSYKKEFNCSEKEKHLLKSSFKGKLWHYLKKNGIEEPKQDKKKTYFISRNTLFGIPAGIEIAWKFKPKFVVSLKFEMSDFLKFLVIITLLAGFLGSITIKHYIFITLISTFIFYALNFIILYVWAEKLIKKILYSIIPDYFDSIETQKNQEKYGDTPKSYELKDVSRKGNFSIDYHYKENEKDKR